MSREEAIELLDNLIGMVEDNHNSDYDTAFTMAIKALGQEHCGDAISRQAVHIELEKWITYGEYKYSNATKYLYDRIDRLPPVNPQKEGEYLKSAIRISKNIPKEMVEKVFFDTQAKMEVQND